MRVLSLFDGISCGMIALERCGISVEKYEAYEIDDNAIKISQFNYPMIQHNGNVFDAKYRENEFELLMGGSPCTFWSIARTKGREIIPNGFGYELFMQYVRALRESNPKYFIYENNYSISKDIKDEISKQLGVTPIMINSSLVSAQNRKRLYWTNIPGVEIPNDKNIHLSDVVDFSNKKFREVGKWAFGYWGGRKKIDMLKSIKSDKSHTLTTSKTHPMNYYLNEDRTKYCNLSINDWEKLQTLPVGYVEKVNVKETAKYKGIGNGWTVDVISHVLSNLPDAYKGV